MSIKKVLLSISASAFLLSACGADEEPAEEDTTEPETEDVADSEPEEQAELEDESTDEEMDETDELEPEESDEGESDETELGTLTTHSQVMDINETQENGPFNVTLVNASLADLVVADEHLEWFEESEATLVALELEVENTTEETNAIYPDQGTIVTNTGQQIDADLLMSDDVGGDFLGEVTKSGTVFFFFQEDPEAIDSVRYIIDSGHDENFENFGDSLEFSVDF